MCAIVTHCKICKAVSTVSTESGRWEGGNMDKLMLLTVNRLLG